MNRNSILSFIIVATGTGALLATTATSQFGAPKAYVNLQPTTPGTSQSGHANISGTLTAEQFQGGGAGLAGVDANLLDGLDSTAFLQSIPVPLNLSGTSSTHIIRGANASTNGGSTGVLGVSSAASGITFGVHGRSESTEGTGVYGFAPALSGPTYGVLGESYSTGGRGISGSAYAGSGITYGVHGQSASSDGRGVYGLATAASGYTYGGRFESNSISGFGVYAVATAVTPNPTFGVYAETRSSSNNAAGVYGVATAGTGTTAGVYGLSSGTDGRGVYGEARAGSGTNYGVYGQSVSQNGTGVHGNCTFGIGVHGDGFDGVKGETRATDGRGIWGRTSATSGCGVFGNATAGSGGTTYGGYFETNSIGANSTGVRGEARAQSGTTYGVWGVSQSTTWYGVVGVNDQTGNTITYGVYGRSATAFARGVYGAATATSGNPVGVLGESNGIGWGLYALGSSGASGTKSFCIDHPDDPENKYLLHYSTESPMPQNFYVGNVVTDSQGYAWVELPDYFGEINTNFKYQLTVIDESDSDHFIWAKVVKKINGNVFRIRTNEPNIEVSWRVDADRNDLYVRDRKPKDVVEKQGRERGTYQHPELYGMPKERGMNYRPELEKLEMPVKRKG